jgi:hypothetical protein
MLGASRHAVHIMDREGDNYDLFAQMSAESVRYVIRLAHNRRLVGETEKLKEFASKGRCIFKREVRLAPGRGWQSGGRRLTEGIGVYVSRARETGSESEPSRERAFT